MQEAAEFEHGADVGRPSATPDHPGLAGGKQAFRRLFHLRLLDLRRDQQDPERIDADVRASTQLAGTNLWVLFFAILIASVGLNTNSPAVIIGAMLISPLMGPIVGAGYGAAVNDLALIRKAGRSLGLFVLLSLIASLLYFAASPLDEPGSELLARTAPTVWDVLIATFGGAAGMVAVTRRGYSNVIPGVAIATALMPPLCTTGFGLAHGRWDMAAGAFYLFLINSMFIAAASLLVAKLLRLPALSHLDEATTRRHRTIIATGLIVILVPSIYLAWRLVHLELFAHGAQRVAERLEADPQSKVLSHAVDPGSRTLTLTVIGRYDGQLLLRRARSLLAAENLADVAVVIRQAGDAPLDLPQLRRQLLQEVQLNLAQQVQATETRVHQLETQVEALRASPHAVTMPEVRALDDEIRAQRPEVTAVTLAQGFQLAVPGEPARPVMLVVVSTSRPLRTADRAALQRWLAVRTGQPELRLIEQPAPRAKKPAAR